MVDLLIVFVSKNFQLLRLLISVSIFSLHLLSFFFFSSAHSFFLYLITFIQHLKKKKSDNPNYFEGNFVCYLCFMSLFFFNKFSSSSFDYINCLSNKDTICLQPFTQFKIWSCSLKFWSKKKKNYICLNAKVYLCCRIDTDCNLERINAYYINVGRDWVLFDAFSIRLKIFSPNLFFEELHQMKFPLKNLL